jgi:hypothetical protein
MKTRNNKTANPALHEPAVGPGAFRRRSRPGRAAALICQPNRGKNYKMPKMPKSVQFRPGQRGRMLRVFHTCPSIFRFLLSGFACFEYFVVKKFFSSIPWIKSFLKNCNAECYSHFRLKSQFSRKFFQKSVDEIIC